MAAGSTGEEIEMSTGRAGMTGKRPTVAIQPVKPKTEKPVKKEPKPEDKKSGAGRKD